MNASSAGRQHYPTVRLTLTFPPPRTERIPAGFLIMEFVTVTPAGRRRYLEILATHLLRNRDVIDELHWWLNTRDPHDVACIHRLADRYPNFSRHCQADERETFAGRQH